ncbi:hypothetical protein M6B38_168440 [Iris pallida]|uniref:Uncharacterized protein n=1 Tax=Iris pallida TaxID=29817 RepID=A0AAX6EV83_IRIPA|nr:hypothetical protein M6B38_168440 [Iris pallida]
MAAKKIWPDTSIWSNTRCRRAASPDGAVLVTSINRILEFFQKYFLYYSIF